MPTHSQQPVRKGRRRGLSIALIAAIAIIGQTACTRDDVAAAISTVAVELEATLQPWGATTVANAQSAYSTAKAPVSPTAEVVAREPSVIATVTTITERSVTATAVPPTLPASSTPPQPTSSPTVSATATIIATITATSTATTTPSPTSTPYPDVTEVPGGSMILINSGVFQMGASADLLAEECSEFREGCQPNWFSASQPVHTVLLDRFYIDAHEVTNKAFATFLNETGASCNEFPCLDVAQSQINLQNDVYSVSDGLDRYPITGVTWFGATAYCEWRGARLPTEAEWEKAAAWDENSKTARRYPWGNEFDGSVVNICDASCTEPQVNTEFNDGFPTMAPVASFEGGRSPAGLYDMAGNVWEWVADWYDPSYYAQSDELNPTGPATGEERVVRGGSWFDTGNFTASAIRFPSSPDNADQTIGFRCAAGLP